MGHRGYVAKDTFHLHIKPSAIAYRLIMGIYFFISLYLFCLYFFFDDITLLLMMFLLIGVSGFFYFSYLKIKNVNNAVLVVENSRDGSFFVDRREKLELVRLQGSSFVSPWLILINLRDKEKSTYCFFIFYDSVEEDAFRRLGVRLR